jgi:hypothetical protein
MLTPYNNDYVDLSSLRTTVAIPILTRWFPRQGMLGKLLSCTGVAKSSFLAILPSAPRLLLQATNNGQLKEGYEAT